MRFCLSSSSLNDVSLFYFFYRGFLLCVFYGDCYISYRLFLHIVFELDDKTNALVELSFIYQLEES